MEAGDFAYILLGRFNGRIVGGEVSEVYLVKHTQGWQASIYGIGRGWIGKDVFATLEEAQVERERRKKWARNKL